MENKTKIAIFEGQKIRRHWDEKEERWYFSVVDIGEVLTGSTIPCRYWSDLKIKLQKESSYQAKCPKPYPFRIRN